MVIYLLSYLFVIRKLYLLLLLFFWVKEMFLTENDESYPLCPGYDETDIESGIRGGDHHQQQPQKQEEEEEDLIMLWNNINNNNNNNNNPNVADAADNNNNESTDVEMNMTSTTTFIPSSYRRIQPKDRDIIQTLHETWFPVTYQKEFYDNLVLGRMVNTGQPLFTNVVVNDKDDDKILACLVGMIVNGTKLNVTSRQLLLPEWPYKHDKAFYIMTLGTIVEVRNQGLATSLIDDCIKRVIQRDKRCGTLYLHVITTNESAIRFYERLSFFRVQEIENYYTIDGQNYNCYLYARYFHGNRGHLGVFKYFSYWLSSLWQKLYINNKTKRETRERPSPSPRTTTTTTLTTTWVT